MADNQFQVVARYRKARNLATALAPIVNAGLLSEEQLEMGRTDENFRAAAAKLAGGNVPSDITWALVMELLQEVRTT